MSRVLLDRSLRLDVNLAAIIPAVVSSLTGSIKLYLALSTSCSQAGVYHSHDLVVAIIGLNSPPVLHMEVGIIHWKEMQSQRNDLPISLISPGAE